MRNLLFIAVANLVFISNAQSNPDRYTIVKELKPFLLPLMEEKLDKTSAWTYLSLPEHASEEATLARIRNFIDHHLGEFIVHCSQVLPYITEYDSESISSSHPTQRALAFIDLFRYLERHGFFGARDFKKPINFWSGSQAKRRAFETNKEMTDSKIPVFCVMFDVCRAIQKAQGKYSNYITLLTSSISRVFAASASSCTNIYLSSDKLLEGPGFTVPNNMWLAELPTLISLYRRGEIEDIVVHLYDQGAGIWMPGISLFSAEGRQIPVYRRSLHNLDDATQHNRFKTQHMSDDQVEQWQKSESRPFIAYGTLGEIAMKLLRTTKRK